MATFVTYYDSSFGDIQYFLDVFNNYHLIVYTSSDKIISSSNIKFNLVTKTDLTIKDKISYLDNSIKDNPNKDKYLFGLIVISSIKKIFIISMK